MRASRSRVVLLAVLPYAAALLAAVLIASGDRPAPAAAQAREPARARAEATVAVLPGKTLTRASSRCSPNRRCGATKQGGTHDDSIVTYRSGDAEVFTEIPNGRARAEALAVARSLDLFDGLITAYGVRYETKARDGRRDREWRVQGLVVAGTRYGTIENRKRTIPLPDGVGEVRIGDTDAGLTVELDKDFNELSAGDEIVIASVRTGATDGAEETTEPEPEDTAEPEATEEPSSSDDDDTGDSGDSGDGSDGSGGDGGSSSSGDDDPSGSDGGDDPDPTATATASPTPDTAPRKPAPTVQQRLTGQQFAFPVYGDKVTIADDFGGPRQIGPHQGNDIFAPFGAPVLAVADGTVTKVGTLKISGNRLWLRTDQGDAFFYAHLSAFSPEAVSGRKVKAGTVLGFTGNTGDAEPTPPHVHFEVHPGGIDRPAIDPHPFLLAWRDGRDVPPGAWLSRYGQDTDTRPGALVEVDDFIARQGG